MIPPIEHNSNKMNELVRQSRQEMKEHNIPDAIYQRWRAHYHTAKTREIPFRFTLLEWCNWWMEELDKIGPRTVRGRGRDMYVMCRFGDAGAYEVGNVFAGTPKQNQNDRTADNKAIAATKMRQWHADHICHLKGKTGAAHPKSRAVVTPEGRYASIAEASAAAGITRQGGFFRVRRVEWQYG
jgi:hypothetical protein